MGQMTEAAVSNFQYAFSYKELVFKYPQADRVATGSRPS